jgi:molybdopterin-guanine dinucleotide biosynthesis protein A
MLPVDLIVLAGGRGSRLGGVLKPAVQVAGRSLLSRVLDARPLAQQAVVVGPADARPAAIDAHGNAVSVIWALEDPPFGGPVAGLAAGLAALDAAHETTRLAAPEAAHQAGHDAAHDAAHEADAPTLDAADAPPLDEPADWVLVLACDLPYGAEAARTLLTCTSALLQIDDVDQVDGVHFNDYRGRPQWLAALYRAPALRAAIARLGDRVDGASMRTLLEGLPLAGLLDESTASADVDTWEDVESSTARLTGAPDRVARPEE